MFSVIAPDFCPVHRQTIPVATVYIKSAATCSKYYYTVNGGFCKTKSV